MNKTSKIICIVIFAVILLFSAYSISSSLKELRNFKNNILNQAGSGARGYVLPEGITMSQILNTGINGNCKGLACVEYCKQNVQECALWCDKAENKDFCDKLLDANS